MEPLVWGYETVTPAPAWAQAPPRENLRVKPTSCLGKEASELHANMQRWLGVGGSLLC